MAEYLPVAGTTVARITGSFVHPAGKPWQTSAPSSARERHLASAHTPARALPPRPKANDAGGSSSRFAFLTNHPFARERRQERTERSPERTGLFNLAVEQHSDGVDEYLDWVHTHRGGEAGSKGQHEKGQRSWWGAELEQRRHEPWKEQGEVVSPTVLVPPRRLSSPIIGADEMGAAREHAAALLLEDGSLLLEDGSLLLRADSHRELMQTLTSRVVWMLCVVWMIVLLVWLSFVHVIFKPAPQPPQPPAAPPAPPPIPSMPPLPFLPPRAPPVAPPLAPPATPRARPAPPTADPCMPARGMPAASAHACCVVCRCLRALAR